MAFLSVIIPVYNNFDRMKRCLMSLECQTCSDFELIVVDDCSTDDTYDRLARYSEDSNMQLWLTRSEKNLGPGPSRNCAMKQAQGSYITFLDSDDYLRSDAIESLRDALVETGADAILFDFSYNKNRLITPARMLLTDRHGYVPTNEAVVYARGCPWGKAYRRDIVLSRRVEFAGTRNAEDIPFTKTALSYCERIYYLRKNLYVYVQHENSLIHDSRMLDIQNTRVAMEYLEKTLSDRYPREFSATVAEYLFFDVCVMLRFKNSRERIVRYIESVERKHPDCYEAARYYCKWNSRMKRLELKLLLCVKGRKLWVLKLYGIIKRIVKKAVR